MEEHYLYRLLPWLIGIEESRRSQFLQMFRTAPLWLIESLRVDDVEQGVKFVREGEPATMIYYVMSGTIKATEYRFHGITFDFIRFDRLYAMGGMEVLMDMYAYGTTLETVTPCKIIKLSRSMYEKWLGSDIQAVKNEAKLMGEYLLEQGRLSRAYLFLQGSNRLAMLLADRYERYAKHGVLKMRGHRQSLSDATGLCVKTINRAVRSFTEEGIISRDKTTLIINEEQYTRLKQRINQVIEAESRQEEEDESD
ncbi:MAG: helix-turn-helix domain-containing protein [Lachnospiraceae bacterium]|nr:helix-turn-helix domain-containing protein [Lachnospiraceae bacterium]MDY5741372.1 helix-turn-helix domain-containing protein [Lachnospiraceae bacterium]